LPASDDKSVLALWGSDDRFLPTPADSGGIEKDAARAANLHLGDYGKYNRIAGRGMAAPLLRRTVQ
jgi:hypothetical protein